LISKFVIKLSDVQGRNAAKGLNTLIKTC